MAELAAECLDDPRVRLVQADVADVIGAARGLYDAILLDVDNGPDGLVRQANDRLYSAQGIAAAIAALRPGGILAIWRSEEHTSELQSLMRISYAVFCLKNKKTTAF